MFPKKTKGAELAEGGFVTYWVTPSAKSNSAWTLGHNSRYAFYDTVD